MVRLLHATLRCYLCPAVCVQHLFSAVDSIVCMYQRVRAVSKPVIALDAGTTEQ